MAAFYAPTPPIKDTCAAVAVRPCAGVIGVLNAMFVSCKPHEN